jgi:hypothetical protein
MNCRAKKFLQQKYRIGEIGFDELTPIHQMPILKKEFCIPDHLIAFSDIHRKHDYAAGVHMFLDDDRLECIWNNPEYYIEKLKKFQCVFSPDYSTLLDMNKNNINWCSYRSKHIGVLLQRNGIHVIPSVSWAGRNTYDACFDGLPCHSVVAVSTVGVMQKKDSLKFFIRGFREMISRLSPSTIILYGLAPCFDFETPPIVHFENTNLMWKKGYQPVLLEEVI